MGSKMLFAAAVLLLFYSGASTAFAQLDPLPGPDLSKCNFTHLVSGAACCLESLGQTPIIFKPNSSIPYGIRRSMQTAFQDAAYVRTLTLGYQRMKDLYLTNPRDPRGIDHQRRLHCSYCSGGFTYGRPYDIHGGWFFAPWHRMMLYHHERILAELARDPAFKLPFWNWDNKAGRALPQQYTRRSTSALYNPVRDHSLANIYDLVDKAVVDEQIWNVMYDSRSTELFFGCPQHGCQVENGTIGELKEGGRLENSMHNAIHSAVGQKAGAFHDMGSLEFAGRDPLFYAHHANVDRLWTVWLGLPKSTRTSRSNPTDAVWRNSRFTMYSAGGKLVSMAVSDVLDTKGSLAHDYEVMKHDWEKKPTYYFGGAGGYGGGARELRPLFPVPSVIKPIVPRGPFLEGSDPFETEGGSVVLDLNNRPPPTPRSGGVDLVNVVSFFGMNFQRSEKFSFRVFLNLPDADINTPTAGNPHYVATYYHTSGVGFKDMNRNIKIPIDGAIEALGISREEVTISVVPNLKGSARQDRPRRGSLRCHKASMRYVRA